MAASNAQSADFQSFYNTINGDQVSGAEVRYGVNPSTGAEIDAGVPVATRNDVDKAVHAATQASKGWYKGYSLDDRRQNLKTYAEVVKQYKGELAAILTREHGMPKTYQDDIGTEQHATLSYTPLGVVVAIVPWNFPMQIACGKIACAVLTGNSVIVKPSPQAPYTILKVVELASTIFPPGVIQALNGTDELGQWLTEHEGVDKISFTGSTAVGKKIMQSASQSMKRLTLELGGNDVAVICPDVDIAATVQQILTLGVLNSGQICMAPQRLYVHESIYAAFLEAAVQFANSVQAIDGVHGAFLGPVQNKQQYDRLRDLIAAIPREGGRIASNVAEFPETGGFLINPVIVDQPADDSRVVREERFGLIIALLKWSDENEVIDRINSSRSGLGASVWSKDTDRATRVAVSLEAGNIWINRHMEVTPRLPFGGLKESTLQNSPAFRLC
ncbi:Aldehyde/histidinol dehydrogenase [Aspergillus stella-maris]|uniref:Aldehyde/histidinol dehydrogenase n=1 Tax=Aspergillus stella-maris TaxID=1810926 RepID=UPI003CCCC043